MFKFVDIATIFVILGISVNSFTPRSYYELLSSRKRENFALKDVDSAQNIVDDQPIPQALIESLISSKRSYPSIIVERLVQSIDDFQLSSKIKSITKEIDKEPMRKFDVIGTKREKIIVLGTGWGSYSFLKSLDSTKYDVVVISPRNYFMFTPMLAASATGTVEFKSICDPIRNVNTFVDYLEATASSINAETNQITCRSLKCEGTSCEFLNFEVNYDYLVVAVGASTNTYGIKGVSENCLFLKQIDDASNIRRAIVNCFERANVPKLNEDEIRTALSFVIVGAGPTGVEFTGELRDWLEYEGRKYYSGLLKYVKITLIEAGNYILPVFDEALRQEALKDLTERKTRLISDGLIDREVTSVILRAGVTEVKEDSISLSNGEVLKYGFCVWAAGNGPLPFVEKFISSIPEQKEHQAQARARIVTDSWLKVLGTKNVFSIGDCAYMLNNSLPSTAQVASQEGAYLGRLFSKGYFMKVPAKLPPLKKIVEESDDANYFSELVNVGNLAVTVENIDKSEQPTIEIAKNFQFLNLGVLAYVGASKALAQISVDDKNLLGSGTIGFLLWRGVYWFKQVSWRNRVLVAIDWFKARLFGRDIGAF